MTKARAANQEEIGMSEVYHSGEIEVQTRAGMQEMASRVGKSIRDSIPKLAQDFLRQQPLVVLGSVDAAARVWASLLTGEPGFLQALDKQTVRIATEPLPGDPLRENLRACDDIGMIAIEFATRRRMRLNGKAEWRPDGLYLHARQVYSNCPKYIQAREWQADVVGGSASEVRQGQSLTGEQQEWIRQADTFFIASHHSEGGADASHRGGNPGFVCVLAPNRLVWPDYTGNTMFQTLGNIATNPNTGLLFMDFEQGSTLQITGRAQVVWDAERVGKFAGAERLVEFEVGQVIEARGVAGLRWCCLQTSPMNPEIDFSCRSPENQPFSDR